MHVVVNGETRDVPEGATIGTLLHDLGFEGLCAVEVNREVIPRATHATYALGAGDAIEIVHFVGGG